MEGWNGMNNSCPENLHLTDPKEGKAAKTQMGRKEGAKRKGKGEEGVEQNNWSTKHNIDTIGQPAQQRRSIGRKEIAPQTEERQNGQMDCKKSKKHEKWQNRWMDKLLKN